VRIYSFESSVILIKPSLSIAVLLELARILRWPHRLTVRTLPSHGKNKGSIPLGATSLRLHGLGLRSKLTASSG
jgi:hypothetical protein